MSRTKRYIPSWVKSFLERYPDNNDPRCELYRGYDDHSRSYLKVSQSGWPEDFRSSITRVFFKRKMSKFRRKQNLKEINNQLFD